MVTPTKQQHPKGIKAHLLFFPHRELRRVKIKDKNLARLALR